MRRLRSVWPVTSPFAPAGRNKELIMARYVALVDHDKAGFGVVFPDAPGATAMGHTLDEALSHATEALSDWIGGEVEDGRPIVKPRSWAALKKDKDVVEA